MHPKVRESYFNIFKNTSHKIIKEREIELKEQKAKEEKKMKL